MKGIRITHILSLVLALAVLFASVTPAFAAKQRPPKSGPTIAEIAIQNGNFTTLVAALVYTGLDAAVANPNARLTVFAPTDEAFAKLGLNADNITSLDKEVLTDILLYHVSRGVRTAELVLAKPYFRMLNGDFVQASVREDGAYINESKILAVDIFASNGVIHVIDSVLLPPAE